MKRPKIKHHPLLSWDVSSGNIIKPVTLEREISFLTMMKKKLGWREDLSPIFRNHFDAIILTDTDQRIIWVSSGFEKMTGYSYKFAEGKTPSFLQGNATSLETKNKINELIKKEIPFTESILNYRRNHEIYWCEVNIYPLTNLHNRIISFIAVEKEVSEPSFNKNSQP